MRLPKAAAILYTRWHYWHQYYQGGEPELRELPNYVSKNKVSLDIGGNVGVYTYHLGRLSGEVITFEPNPKFVQYMRRAGLKNEIHPVALSDRDGVAELRVPAPNGNEDSGMASLEASAVPEDMLSRCLDIDLKRLDDYSFKNVGFIKIDVEGHEESVIRGAMATIEREKPVLLIEIEERHNPGGVERVKALLHNHDAFFFQSGTRLPFSEFNINEHQNLNNIKPGLKSIRNSGYVNNFLFLPRPH